MTPAKAKETYIADYCHLKGYQVVKTEVANGIKLEISNLSEKIPVTIFDTGKMLPQGSPKSLLFQEFQKLKTDLEQNPDLLKNTGTTIIKSCNQRYEIIISELQNAIKDGLSTLGYEVDLQTNSNANEIYRAKIQNNSMNLSIIQYKSGTLLLQGKQNSLFDDICSIFLMRQIIKTSKTLLMLTIISRMNKNKN